MNGEQREQTSVKIRKRGFDNLYNCLVNANLPTVEPIPIIYYFVENLYTRIFQVSNTSD